MIEYRFRPIVWTGPKTPSYQRRARTAFSASWSSTLELLEAELFHLNAKDVNIQADLRLSDIRLDGLPRANARIPDFPGVIINLTAYRRPLQYKTDVCTFWQHNVRSIALGLQALRAVDRYGISGSGEQYIGWTAIGDRPYVPDTNRVAMTKEEALEYLRSVAGGREEPVRVAQMTDKMVYRLAQRVSHPDNQETGSSDVFIRVQEAGWTLGL